MRDALDRRILGTVVVVCILVSGGADVFNPALPDLQKYFALSSRQVSWVLNANFAGVCIVTVVAGLLGDRIGKRALVVGGLVLFAIGSLLALTASSFGMLIVGRVAQGVGAAFPAVLAFVLLVELSPPFMHARLVGLVSGTVSVAMCVAPLIGTLLVGAWGWRASFVVLLAYAICAVLLVIVFLPASPPQIRRLDSGMSYRSVVTSGEWWLLTIIVNLLRGNYLAFASFSSILYVGELGVDIHTFGFFQGALTLTFALASACSGRIVGALGELRAVTLSLVAMPVISGAMLLYVTIAAAPRAIAITLFMMAISVLVAFPMNVLFPKSLSVVPDALSRASAASNVVKWCVTGSLIWAFARPAGDKVTWIAALLFVFYLVCLCIFLGGGRSSFNRSLTGRGEDPPSGSLPPEYSS